MRPFWALIRKEVHESRWALGLSVAALFGLGWLFVYVTSLNEAEIVRQLGSESGDIGGRIQFLRSLGIMEEPTSVSLIMASWNHPFILIVISTWAIGRGSGAVAAEVERGTMDLFLFASGYGGLCLVEGDTANLCLVVRRSRLRDLGGWPELLKALLDENRHIRLRLAGGTPLWERPLAVSSIPYGHLSGASCGLWCVGDQAAVIPSFTGDGMAIALHSGALGAEMYTAGKSPAQYHETLGAQLGRGMSLATLLSRLMVSSAGRRLAPIALAVVPGAMSWIARSTRIPEAAVLSRLELTAGLPARR